MAKSREHIPIQLVDINLFQHHQFQPPFIFHIYIYMYMYIRMYLHSRYSSFMLVKSPPISKWISIIHHESSHYINPLSQVFIVIPVIPHASYGSIAPSTSASYLHTPRGSLALSAWGNFAHASKLRNVLGESFGEWIHCVCLREHL